MGDWLNIFNANAPAGDPTSSAAQALRQRLALEMMTKKRAYPKTFGEGLAAIGDSLGEMGMQRQLLAQQTAYEKAVSDTKAKDQAGPQAAAEPAAKVAEAPVEEPPQQQASVFPDPSTAQASIPQSMVAQLGPAPAAASAAPPASPASIAAAAPRDRIANLLANGSAALDGPEVSQANPTVSGPTAPMNLPYQVASLGGPPEAALNRPIQQPDVKPASQMMQVAQSAMTLPQPMTQQPTPPRQAPGIYDKPGAVPTPPPVPKDPRQADYEQKALRTPSVELQTYYKEQAAILAAERAKRQAIADEAFRNQLAAQSAKERAWEDAQRGLPRTQAEATEAQAKALTAQGGAELTRRTGLPADVALKKFDTLKTTADKDAFALQQLRLASDAINKGLVSGAGGELRLNIERLKAYMGNASADEIATRTQLYQAAIKSTIANALQNVQPGDTRVTNADQQIALGMIGGDIATQRNAMRKLVDVQMSDVHKRIDQYEDLKDRYLKGLGVEGFYDVRFDPIHPKEEVSKAWIDKLIKNQSDFNARAAFDKEYGPGSADLEIARARRRRRLE